MNQSQIVSDAHFLWIQTAGGHSGALSGFLWQFAPDFEPPYEYPKRRKKQTEPNFKYIAEGKSQAEMIFVQIFDAVMIKPRQPVH